MLHDVVSDECGRLHWRHSWHARKPGKDRMRFQNAVGADETFRLPIVNILNHRQCASMMFVIGHAGRHEHIGVKKVLHFTFAVPALILPSRSRSMSSLTCAVVIGSENSPVKTRTLPLRINSPPASDGSSLKLFPSTERRSLSPGKRLNCSRNGLGSTTRPALSI